MLPRPAGRQILRYILRSSNPQILRSYWAMSKFRSHPDPSVWDHYVDFESTSWPKKEKRNYWIVPSICFNCESACCILAYVDKEKKEVRKIKCSPMHPGS